MLQKFENSNSKFEFDPSGKQFSRVTPCPFWRAEKLKFAAAVQSLKLLLEWRHPAAQPVENDPEPLQS